MYAAKINSDMFVFLSHEFPEDAGKKFNALIACEKPITYLINPNVNEKKVRRQFFFPYPDRIRFRMENKLTICDSCIERVKMIYAPCESCLYVPKTGINWNENEVEAHLMEKGYEIIKPRAFYDLVFHKEKEHSRYLALDIDLLSSDFNIPDKKREQNEGFVFDVPIWTYNKKGEVQSRVPYRVCGTMISDKVLLVHTRHIHALAERKRPVPTTTNRSIMGVLSKYKYEQRSDALASLPYHFIESFYCEKAVWSTIDQAPIMQLISKGQYETYVTDGINVYTRKERSDLTSLLRIKEDSFTSKSIQYYIDEHFLYKRLGPNVLLRFNVMNKTKVYLGKKRESITEDFGTLNELLQVYPDATCDFELVHPHFIGKRTLKVGDDVVVVNPKRQQKPLLHLKGIVLEITDTYKIGFCNNYFTEIFTRDEIA